MSNKNKKVYNVVTLDGGHINKQDKDFMLKKNFATLCSIGGNYDRPKQDSSRNRIKKIF